MRQLVPRGTILELGSGEGTSRLAEHHRVFSVEDDSAWVGRHPSTYIFAQQVNGWYDAALLAAVLPLLEYDALLIDGPKARGSDVRLGILDHLNLFRLDVPIFVDDVQRDAEKELLDALAKETGRAARIVAGQTKDFGYIK